MTGKGARCQTRFWLFVFLVWPSFAAAPSKTSPQVKINGIYFQVELARSDDEWKRGLMFREKLARRQGMLFVGKTSRPQAFWMKNTLIPLDIIFISAGKKIVSITKGTTPQSETPLPSRGPAMHILEVLAGQADAAKMKPGDSVEFLNIRLD